MTTPSTANATSAPANNRPTGWVVEFVLLAAIWGASFLFMHLGALEFGPLPTAGGRVAIATVFLLPILMARGHGAELRKHWKLTFAVGVLNSALPFASIAFALLAISTGLSSILNATVPLFGAAVAWLWLKDRLQGSRVVGLLIGFLGVALLAGNKASFTPTASGLSTGWAIFLCLFACLCYGIAASFTRRYLGGVPSLVLAAGSQLGATLVLAPLAWWFWPTHPVSTKAWLALVALGVVCTGVAYVLYFRLIERAGPAKALSVTFAIPVFAIVYGVVLLGESVTAWMVGCGLVILLGTSLSAGLIRWGDK